MKNQRWKHKLIALYTGQFFSLITSAAVQFSIIWWLTDTTGSPLVLAVAGIAGFLPQALVGPFAGAIVDRHSRKTMMLLADSVVAMASLILAGWMIFAEPNLVLVMLVLAVRSLATAFHMPAMQASIPLLAPEEHLTKVAGWGQTVSSITNIVGPAVGMSLLAISTLEWVLLLDVIGALIACGILAVIHIPNAQKPSESPVTSGILSEMKEGYQAILKNRLLFKLTIVVVTVSFLYIPIGTYFPLLVRNHFAKGVIEAGIVEAIFATGLVLGGAFLGILGDCFDKVKTMASSIILMGITLVISGLTPPSGFYLFGGMSLLIGFSGPLFSAPFYAFIQTTIEPHLLGRVFSFIGSISLLTAPLGLGIAGLFTEWTNVATFFATTGVLVLICGLAVFKIK